MDREQIGNLRICFPKWFIIIYTFCAIFTLLFFAIYMIFLINRGKLVSEMFNFIFFLVAILAGLWVLSRILFYSIIVTDKGLKTHNIFGSNMSVLWDEIIEVRRPKFGIPVDFTYVFLSNKSKLILIRSMQNYKKLIQLIKEKAPNLQKCEF